MFVLTIAVLVALSVVLIWPSQGIRRLHLLGLPRDPGAGGASLPTIRSRRVVNQEQAAVVIDALGSLEAELHAGQAPAAALARAAGQPPAWPMAVAALRVGADVASALRADAVTSPLLGQLAACWDVASHSGSGLGQSVAILAESARTREELEATLNAELAGPRATARVLVLLPAIGLLLGMGLGADPLGWLLGNPIGLLCGAGGLLLTVAGSAWSRHIVRKVERQW